MSTPRVRSSEHERRAHNETSEPLSPEPALRVSRDLPSTSHPEAKSAHAVPPEIEGHLLNSESRLSLPPVAQPLSESRSPSTLRSHSHDRSSVSSQGTLSSTLARHDSQENQQIIVRSFAPRVAVYASIDTEDFIQGKGFKDGLYSLLRPYGERLTGKVIIRDSIGGSKAWDDFAIRFVDSRQPLRSSGYDPTEDAPEQDERSLTNAPSPNRSVSRTRDPGTAIDQLLNHYLQAEDRDPSFQEGGYPGNDSRSPDTGSNLPSLYSKYLRKLLSNSSLVPYETFSHPVACLITVTSHHPAPIEALRQLYLSTGHGSNHNPAWVGTEYLRYYVLIHDEEKDDITKSTALFNLMKQHFGLHCHLLRLRSSQCVQTDDDSSRVPRSEWLSAEEETDQIRARDYTDEYAISEGYILESDATAVKALLREMVVQSIVPFMENRMMTWNDQVASRRRGISGRFMSLSKRWTGFGSARNAASGSGTAASSSSNFNHQKGFYPPETPEATMRQLGDYAFMLRDWKLAYSTYDFIRTEFSHDKAWSYHAAANEMAAITSLLTTQMINSRSRLENINQMLDTAAYSYLTRCAMPSNAVRCLTLATELFQNRGPVAVDDAARWVGRLLELGVLTPLAQALMAERLADCYCSRIKAALPPLGTRKRQAALWNVLASESWSKLGNSAQAHFRLRVASKLYESDEKMNVGPPFPNMQPFWQHMDRTLRDTEKGSPSPLIDLGAEDDRASSIAEESEQLNALPRPVFTKESSAKLFMAQDTGRSNDLQESQDGFSRV